MYLSFIVPVYNAERYLDKCLSSLCNIKREDVEIIVVNDGSIDASAEIGNHFVGLDSRVKVIYQENQGVSVARNTGLDSSSGDWICFIDADDWIDEKFEDNIVSMLDETVDILYYGIRFTEKEQIEIDKSLIKCESSYLTSEELQKKLLNNDYYVKELEICENINITLPFGKIIKKTLLDQYSIKFEKGLAWGEDIVFNFELLKYVKKISFLNQIGYLYRINNSSITQRYNDKALDYYQKLVSVVGEKILYKNEVFDGKFNLFVIRQFLFTAQRSIFNKNYKAGITQKRDCINKILNWNLMKKALKEADFSEFRFTIRIPAMMLKYHCICGLDILYMIKHRLDC